MRGAGERRGVHIVEFDVEAWHRPATSMESNKRTMDKGSLNAAAMVP